MAGQSFPVSLLADGPVSLGIRPDPIQIDAGAKARQTVMVATKDRVELHMGAEIPVDLSGPKWPLFHAETGLRL